MAWKPLTDRTNKYNHCLGCTERKVGCHSTCEKYLADRAVADEIKAELRKKKKEEGDIEGFLKDSAERGVRRSVDRRKYR